MPFFSLCLFTGLGKSGALGHGSKKNAILPTKITALGRSKVVKAAVSNYNTFALTNEGHVYGWGRGNHGILGRGSEEDSCVPERIRKHLSNKYIVDIAAGDEHAIALGVTWL